MSIYELIILSVALALDALIVSFSYGMIISVKRLQNAFILAFAFGFFQFLMPVLGWNFTGLVYSYLEKYSKWIVFVVFLLLGIKFLKEAFSKEEQAKISCISPVCMFGLALATSIDAFGAGVSIKFLGIPILFPSFVIGLITFALSFCGFNIAGSLKSLSEKHIGVLGALLLFYLAVKSVV